ncbi:MAG: hypothetical protein DA328_07120 [Nitrososphaeraceae archaeon]|nr:hypothetical protein [Nitrososphaeraceae archaeon]
MSQIEISNFERFDVRKKLIEFITDAPGIRYRELLRLTGLSNGVLSYHLDVLTKNGRIKNKKTNQRVTRYYPNGFSEEESEIIAVLRQETSRKIIQFIIENPHCTFNEIVDYCGKVPSTISWHLSKLKESEIVENLKSNNTGTYTVKKCDKVNEIIEKHKNSFVQRIVNDYVDMVESI